MTRSILCKLRYVLVLGTTIGGLLTACTERVPSSSSDGVSPVSGNRPPTIMSARFVHEPLSLTEPVAVQIHAEDPEREAVSFHYQWFVDGAPLKEQTNPTLPAELLRRGQKVSVQITPADSSQKGGEYEVGPAIVGNTPPAVTRIVLEPQTPQLGQRVVARVEANDPDYDRIDLTYRWIKNKVVIKEGEDPFLDTSGFSGRDEIAVEVIPYDGAVKGTAARSREVTLGNSPPKIVSTPPAPGAVDHFEYLVRATDADGDRLTFYLDTAPPGMTIDEASGQVRWAVPTNQTGTVHVKIAAKDNQGGIAYQEFDLTLSSASPSKPTGA